MVAAAVAPSGSSLVTGIVPLLAPPFGLERLCFQQIKTFRLDDRVLHLNQLPVCPVGLISMPSGAARPVLQILCPCQLWHPKRYKCHRVLSPRTPGSVCAEVSMLCPCGKRKPIKCRLGLGCDCRFSQSQSHRGFRVFRRDDNQSASGRLFLVGPSHRHAEPSGEKCSLVAPDPCFELTQRIVGSDDGWPRPYVGQFESGWPLMPYPGVLRRRRSPVEL